MMTGIYLKAYGNFPKTMDLETLEVADRGNTVNTVGWYLYIEGKLSALYHKEDRFFIRYDKSLVKIERGYFAGIEKEGDQYRFSLFRRSLFRKTYLVFSFKYSIADRIVEPEFDFTPMIEEEDFNWGLFLSNIINSKSRRRIIIKVSKGKA